MLRFSLQLVGVAALSVFSVCVQADIPLADRRSGEHFMRAETRAMQNDPTANPATFALLEGEALWQKKIGSADKSCFACHGQAEKNMRGVAARFPTLSQGRLMNLEQRIQACRVEQQRASPWPYEHRELLALATYVGTQSKGLPITPSNVEGMQAHRDAGRALFQQRLGQLNLSCAQCHDARWGAQLSGNPIPQAHPTAYPLYRLEWQAVGSLQRRLRNCMTGVRAEPFAFGEPGLVQLESFLMWRARGMPIETPGLRP